MMFNFNVVSIGDLVTDLVIQIPHLPVEAARHQIAQGLSIEPGGAGNFLIAGIRLGMRMTEIGVVGDDLFGKSVVSILEREGVQLDGLLMQPGTTTTTVAALVDTDGKHVFIGKYGEGPELVYPPIWTGILQKADAVFSCGYTLQDQLLNRACLHAMEITSQAGIPMFFDPGPEMAYATRDVCEQVVSLSKVILMTEDEIQFLTGGDNTLQAARTLMERGPQWVCIKRGAHGCTLLTRQGEFEHPGFPVKVRDTSAAGDSFDAAFIAAYLKGWEPQKICEFANAMGAAKVRKMGSGTQVPTAAEVQSILEEFQSGIRLELH
jgi:ribokinase